MKVESIHVEVSEQDQAAQTLHDPTQLDPQR